MSQRSLGHRAPLLWIVVPMMGGLAAGRMADVQSAAGWLIAAALSIVLAALAHFRRASGSLALLAGAMLCAGVASYALHCPRVTAWDNLPPREAQATLVVDRVFPQADVTRFTALGTIRQAAARLEELRGQRAYFSLRLRRGQAAPVRSAVVAVTGVVAPVPRDAALNTFDGYLLSAGVNFRLSRGRLLHEEKPAGAYHRFCARQAERWAAILGLGVEKKQPALLGAYRAILLSQHHELSEDQRTRFRESGTMHVFSISGMHIGVIAAGVQALLLLMRLPRALQFVIGLGALWLYVDVTGAAPSAVRAFVMVALLETAFVLRLPLNPIAALTTSALPVLVVAPLQFFTASFQMSYGIMAALLLLGLPLADRWQEKFALFQRLPRATWRWHHRLRHWAWGVVIGALAISLAASLVSTIAGVLYFQLFTPGALAVNLWIIPAACAVMLAGFASLLCGLAGFTAASLLANHAALVVLWLVEHGVQFSVNLPAMWIPASFRVSSLGPAALAALIVALGAGYARRWEGWQRGFWMPFALVAIVLACGVRFGG